MRSLTRKGLFTIALVFFSASVYAGIVDCDVQLKPNKELKPLYGLCVAYWSSGEEDRLPLRHLYLLKVEKLIAKGIDVPDALSDLPFVEATTCPCWETGEINLGNKPSDCEVDGTYLYVSYDDRYSYEVGWASAESCYYLDYGTFEGISFPSSENGYLTTDEMKKCADDLKLKLVDDFGGCLEP
jgi:hypothetical protein